MRVRGAAWVWEQGRGQEPLAGRVPVEQHCETLSAQLNKAEPVGWDPAVEDPEQQAGLGLGPRHGGQLHQVNIPAVTVGFCNTYIGFLHVVVCL